MNKFQKTILIICAFLFVATLFAIPCEFKVIEYHADTHRMLWELSRYDHIQWQTLGLEWAGIVVLGGLAFSVGKA